MKKIFECLMLVILSVMISLLGITDVYAESGDIEVTDIRVKDKSGTIIVDNPTISKGEINSRIKFNEIDDFVTFELFLKNNESKKFKINSIEDNNSNENIDIKYSYSENYIAKGDTTKITIKMIYKKELLNKEEISLSNLSIKIKLEEEDGSISELVVNPKTGDNIVFFIMLFIMSGLGVFFIATKRKIKGIKIGNLLMLLSILLIPFMVIAKEKYEVSIKFTNIGIVGKFEVYNMVINTGDGNSPIIKEITYGQPIGELPIPEKDGYEFVGWEDSDGNKISSETIVNNQIELIAVYTPIEYSISYDLGTGSLPSGSSNPVKYTIESNDILLANPIKKGYTFVGWTGSNGEDPQTSITIYKGTTGNKSYIAHYSANQGTKYTVIHKYQNIDLTTYEEVAAEEYGATDTEVIAPLRPRAGFKTPVEQKITISGDADSVVTYIYMRETCSFRITDRTYIDSSTTADGNYIYGTEIIVKAQERVGYSFRWSDGITDLERTFNLLSNTVLTPVYTLRNDIPYTVIHKKQKLDLSGYEIEDTQNLIGTPGVTVEPAVNIYKGFISPSIQSTTIAADGSTIITYNYDREMYSLSFNNNEFVTSTKEAGEYPYETEVTITAGEREGYRFKEWSNNRVVNPYTFIMESDLIIEPSYTVNTYYIRFNANGGEGEQMGDQRIIYDTQATLLANTYIRSGYVFKEWNTKEDGSGTSYIDGDSIYNLTSDNGKVIELFAQWEVDKSGTYEWVLHPEESEFASLNTPNRTFIYGSINPFFLIGSQNEISDSIVTKLGFYVDSVSALDEKQYVTVSVFKKCITEHSSDCTITGESYNTLGGTGFVSKQKVYIPTSDFSSTTIRKWINIDVNIPVGKDEILGISMHDDPVTLRYTKESTPSVPLKYYFGYRLGNSNYIAAYDNSLTVNVQVYHPTEEESLYTILKKKKYSILGDSISTFSGWSNNTNYNNTIGNNAVYYGGTNIIKSVDDTYWKQLIDSYDLDLVVNNSYSGNRMATSDRGTAGYLRAEQLHNNDIIPELVTIYMGINDLDNNGVKNLGSISDANIQTYINSKNESSYEYSPVSFTDAYAIYKIIDKYDNPDIFLLNFVPNGTRGGSVESNISAYNSVLEDLVEYYHNSGYSNVILVDQYNYGDISTNYATYMGDANFLHPNKNGMNFLKNVLEHYMIDYYLN